MKPARRFDRKRRNTEIRPQKPIILIVAEGEKLQSLSTLSHFSDRMPNVAYGLCKTKEVKFIISNPCQMYRERVLAYYGHGQER